jgi:hypothetical protein
MTPERIAQSATAPPSFVNSSLPTPAKDTPTPPPGARLLFGDDNGRPCAPEDSHHWTWASWLTHPRAPTWFYTAQTGIPPNELTIRPDYPARCPACVERSLRVAWQEFSNKTMHLRLECARCGKFIKMLKPPPGNPDLEWRAKTI